MSFSSLQLQLQKKWDRGETLTVCFVCHGNICRSPMGEFLFKDMVSRAGVSDRFVIYSRATSTEEIGNPVHYGTRNKLARYNISCDGHRATQMTARDYEKSDVLIGMDRANVSNMVRLSGGQSEKICKMLEWTGSSRDVADPWYTDNFDDTYDDIFTGCTAFLQKVCNIG